MRGIKGIAEVIQMKIFVDGIGMIKHLLGLTARAKAPVGGEEQVRSDRLVLARIAQTCPELIVMADESRDHRL